MDGTQEIPVSDDDISKSFEFFLNQQLLTSTWHPAGQGHAYTRAVISRFANLEPLGAVESMLAAQMIATHDAAMNCLFRANLPNQSLAGFDVNMKHAVKLMALYERQVAALDKRRGHAQQNVTVKHVHVAEGGQAIVGNVTAGGVRSGRAPKAPAALEEDHDACISPIATDSRTAAVLHDEIGASEADRSGARRL